MPNLVTATRLMFLDSVCLMTAMWTIIVKRFLSLVLMRVAVLDGVTGELAYFGGFAAVWVNDRLFAFLRRIENNKLPFF